MGAYRFFTSVRIQPNSSLELTGSEHHHLKNVLRLCEGNEIALFDGAGGLGMGHIQSITRHSSYITLGDVNLSPPPAKKWTLALAWIRPQKIELALEKGTELGIDRFLLFKAKRSERRPPSYERIKTILISALKQSGRLYLPELEIIDKLELPQQAMHEEAVYYGALSPGASPITSPPKNLCFFIGPEGGFTEEELTLFNSATPVGLGPHILRAETAAITAAAQLAQYRL